MTDTQLIKDKIDLAQLIGEYVQLKKAGIYWKANCPFHREKTPSFMVHTERQFWHCFGCGKGGDAFSFIQEIEGLEFAEALKLLADRAGIKLDNFRSEINKSQKNRLLEICAKAAYFFNHVLTDLPTASSARAYLTRRGVGDVTIMCWQIGFIPDQWDLLTKYLLKKGFGVDDLVAAGLTIKKDAATGLSRGFYDRFRGRVMFPLHDVLGNVVGFTGRVLVETERSGGKYVNTPQTLIYDKSRLLYGLNQAKTSIKAKDLAVVVEGQMDVIACHQAGMTNVVASSGTALTLEQVRLLKRYSNNVAIAFDADSAGVAAAKRGIDVALREGLNVRVIRLPDGAGKDADECLKKDKTVWFASVERAQEIMRWFFDTALKGKNLADPKDKQAVANDLLPLISLLPYAVERDHWLKTLASLLDTDINVLREDLKRLQKAPSGDKSADSQSVIQQPTAVPSRHILLLERLLLLFLKSPRLIRNFLPVLPPAVWAESAGAELYDFVQKQYTGDSNLSDSAWLDLFLTSGPRALIDRLQMKSELEFTDWLEDDLHKEANLVATQIREDWLKSERQKLQQALSIAEKSGDTAQVAELLLRFQLLK